MEDIKYYCYNCKEYFTEDECEHLLSIHSVVCLFCMSRNAIKKVDN